MEFSAPKTSGRRIHTVSKIGSRPRYTVYDNRYGSVVAFRETSRDCAKKMGIKFSSWHATVGRVRKNKNYRWTILVEKEEDVAIDRIPPRSALPRMIRVSALSDIIPMTDARIVSICEKHGVEIKRAGAQKIRVVSRDDFYDALCKEFM